MEKSVKKLLGLLLVCFLFSGCTATKYKTVDVKIKKGFLTAPGLQLSGEGLKYHNIPRPCQAPTES